MALQTDIRGMHHEYPDHFEVGREKIREFCAAIKCDDPASLDGQVVMEAYTTLMGQQGENSAKIDFL